MQSTKHHVVVCGLFTNRLKKLFSEIDISCKKFL
ncbi:MAG TPA: hypothetical protein DHV15_11405 [Treponema sp.]|uniref:Uncharacterized protein n=1 Tax=Treponema denticola (strain ATCC 35405 / DSM 14222 / CIP 103919 / JCM 8153 / KCTC 15104) TaxID=243275 RepID=Q73N31_TREDE|nr:hypothetical protein TDE_1325 [Treponema denticola ATCC 35405]HCY96094.1 hypothetical protein [Treponema sp.]